MTFVPGEDPSRHASMVEFMIAICVGCPLGQSVVVVVFGVFKTDGAESFLSGRLAWGAWRGSGIGVPWGAGVCAGSYAWVGGASYGLAEERYSGARGTDP